MNKKDEKDLAEFAIAKDSYKFLAIGFGIIVLGFILMIGGKSEDPNVFNYDMFNFQRITLAPIVVMIGFIFEVWAIMRKPKDSQI
ncbi:MAG TPA: DUF3098 domain-containing protein [Bacteroidales bacterium]|jgi:hypothetical protein|nr:DUF3098 domain-containing protein [Bacteroidales bacterium]